MPLHHAVLALLANGPSYGYELKGSFEEAIGPQWGGLNIGHLYQILERLVRDELVTGKKIPQEDRPDKIVYRLTRKGQAELESWLAQPFVRQSGYRDDFFLKLLAASRLGEEPLRRAVNVQREACLAEVASLEQLRAQQGAPLVALLVDAALLHAQANLCLVELAERQLPQLAAASMPATAEPAVTRRRRAGSAA